MLHLSPNRQNDTNLMDKFFSIIKNQEDLKRLNIVRQYLKVIYLSDITNVLGTHIDYEYFTNQVHDSTLKWPQLTYPPQISWNIWRQTIIKTFCSHKDTTKLKSEFQLGKWIKPTSSLQKKWSFGYSNTTSSIYDMTSNKSSRFRHPQ